MRINSRSALGRMVNKDHAGLSSSNVKHKTQQARSGLHSKQRESLTHKLSPSADQFAKGKNKKKKCGVAEIKLPLLPPTSAFLSSPQLDLISPHTSPNKTPRCHISLWTPDSSLNIRPAMHGIRPFKSRIVGSGIWTYTPSTSRRISS